MRQIGRRPLTWSDQVPEGERACQAAVRGGRRSQDGDADDEQAEGGEEVARVHGERGCQRPGPSLKGERVEHRPAAGEPADQRRERDQPHAGHVDHEPDPESASAQPHPLTQYGAQAPERSQQDGCHHRRAMERHDAIEPVGRDHEDAGVIQPHQEAEQSHDEEGGEPCDEIDDPRSQNRAVCAGVERGRVGHGVSGR